MKHITAQFLEPAGFA